MAVWGLCVLSSEKFCETEFLKLFSLFSLIFSTFYSQYLAYSNTYDGEGFVVSTLLDFAPKTTMSKPIPYDQAVSFKAFGYMGKTYSYFLESGERKTGRKKDYYNSKGCHYAAPSATDALNYLRDRLGVYCDVDNALGYSKPQNAVQAHCRYSLKQGIPHPQSKKKSV